MTVKQWTEAPQSPQDQIIHLYAVYSAIAAAADDLEAFLASQTGTTADWPMDILCDNEETAEQLAALLSGLAHELAPYRAMLKALRPAKE